jgi:hypothetical protein
MTAPGVKIFAFSDDAGNNWERMTPYTPSTGFYYHKFKVSQIDEQVKYFSGVFLNKYIGNQLISFGPSAIGHVDVRAIELIKNDVTNTETIFLGTDGGVTRSDNGGTTWQNLNGSGLAITQFYELAVHEKLRNHLRAGAQDGNNFKLENGEWNIIAGADIHACEFIDENTFAFYNNGIVEIIGGTGYHTGTQSMPMPLKVNRKEKLLYYGKEGGLMKSAGPNYHPTNDTENLLPSTVTRTVKTIGICQNDPNVIFCAFDQPNWHQVVDMPQFYRTINGGDTWEELAPSLICTGTSDWLVTYAFNISVIEIDPENPNRVWVGLSGVSYSGDYDENDQLTNRLFYSENALANPQDIIWQDISAGLPPLPINDLAYQPGTVDLVYAATDVGVFYFDGNSQQWKCFNENLPVCIVTSLKINSCEQKLYASTFGRGAWRADLLKRDRVISQNIFVEEGEELVMDASIILQTGIELTVEGTLLMPIDAKIIVKPGAKVILSGGTIDNICGGMWRGIEVLGTPNQPQLETYQGKVVINNGGTITNALVGVSLGAINENGSPDLSTTGGFLTCSTGAQFVNCRRAVRAYDYQGTFNNRTKFYNTIFEINDELLDSSIPSFQVQMRGVNGVIFDNCTFINSRQDNSSILDAGKGIGSSNSGFRVEHCAFLNLELGIRVKSLGFDDIKIAENTFSGNLGGVSLRYSGLAEVVHNEFNIPAISDFDLGSSHPDAVAYGVFIAGSSGFAVEENTFYGGDIDQNVGVAVQSCGPVPNRIYNNDFGRLGAGIIAMGNNRSTNIYHGLLFECNDLGSFDDPLGYSLALTNEGEVRHYQGFLGANGGAANVFEPFCAPITEQVREFYMSEDTPPLSPVLYFPYLQENTRPDCHTPDMVTIPNSDQSLNKQVRCPSNFSVGGGIEDIKEKFVLNKSLYQGLQVVYNNEYNGGDLEYLEDLVIDPTISSFDLRNELLLASPKVTSRILITAIQRDPEMNPWHLAQVLLANSPLTQDVINALNLSEVNLYYRELVLNGQYGGMTNTTIKESELGHFGGLMEFARAEYVRQLFRQDSTNIWSDSIIHYLSEDASPHLMKTLMAYHIKQNQWQSAHDLLSEASNLRWSNDYVALIDVLIDALSDSVNADNVVASKTAQLLAIAAENSPEAYLAQSILEAYELADFPDYIEMPTGGVKRLVNEKPNKKEQVKPIASMHPNPAKDLIYVNWQLPEGMPPQSTSLIIYNGQGAQLLTRSITSEVGIEEINTANWPSGLYVYQLLHNNKPIHHGKFEVLR